MHLLLWPENQGIVDALRDYLPSPVLIPTHTHSNCDKHVSIKPPYAPVDCMRQGCKCSWT